MPSGSEFASQAAPASSWIVFARSGDPLTDHLPVAPLEVVGRALEHVGGEQARLLPYLHARELERGAADGERAGAERADAVRRVRVSPWSTSMSANGMPSSVSTICDHEVAWPCPCGGRAGDHRGRPGRVQPQDRRLPTTRADADRVRDGGRREPADLDPRRETDAAVLSACPRLGASPLEARVVGHRERLVERARVVARVVAEARRRGVGELLDEVAAPDLGRVDTQLVGEQIHHPLDHVRGLGTPRAAVRVGRRRVGEGPAAGDVDLLDVVGARHHEDRQMRDRRRDELQVRAVVLDELDAKRLNPCRRGRPRARRAASWSRPWIVATIASERSSIHLTGAPTSFDACATANSSA